ncbi:hypothetical protein Tco_1451847, partial [Tanacetum coccineum]
VVDDSLIDEDKKLQIYQMLLSSPRASPVKYYDALSVLVLLMKSSPNLEETETDNDDLDLMHELFTEDDIRSFKLEDYSDMWLEHMRELHFFNFKNWGNELKFVKLVLAKSPMLKKVRIVVDDSLIDEDKKLQIYQMLLSSPRASPVVDVIVTIEDD